MNVLTRMTRRLDGLASALSVARTREKHHCPHCQRQTDWHLELLRGYARCLKCRQNPLVPASDE